jgi:hypothetical protein
VRKVLEAGTHIAQPRHFDICEYAQHFSFAHDGALAARLLRQPFEQRRLGGHRIQNSLRGCQPSLNEALCRCPQQLHSRQDRQHALALRAADDDPGAVDDLADLLRQAFEVLNQRPNMLLRVGNDRPQLTLEILQGAFPGRLLRHRHSASCGAPAPSRLFPRHTPIVDVHRNRPDNSAFTGSCLVIGRIVREGQGCKGKPRADVDSCAGRVLHERRAGARGGVRTGKEFRK